MNQLTLLGQEYQLAVDLEYFPLPDQNFQGLAAEYKARALSGFLLAYQSAHELGCVLVFPWGLELANWSTYIR